MNQTLLQPLAIQKKHFRFKNKLLKGSIFCFLIVLTILGYGQKVEWVEGGGGWVHDYGYDIISDPSGNVYVTGHTGGGSFSEQTIDDWGVYLIKYDPDGDILWWKNFDSPNATGVDMTLDSENNIYLIGYFRQFLTIEGVQLNGDLQASMFVVKYQEDGTFEWVKNYKTEHVTKRLYAGAIGVDQNDNVFITGSFNDVVVFGEDTLDNKIISHGDISDIFLLKLNASGEEQWAQRAGSPYYDYAHGLAIGPNNEVYISGELSPLNADFGDINYSIGNTYRTAFITKYSNDGEALWVRSASSSTVGSCLSVDLDTDSDGNVYAAGSYQGKVTFNHSVSIGEPNTFGGVFLTKYDPDGNFQWVQPVHTTIFNDYVEGSFGRPICGLDVGPNNQIYFTSGFRGSLSIPPFELETETFADVLVTRFNSAGETQWVFTGGSSQVDEGREIHVSPSLDIYTIGFFQDQAAQFGAFSIPNNSGNNNADAFFLKLKDTTAITANLYLSSEQIACESKEVYASLYEVGTDFLVWEGKGSIDEEGNIVCYHLPLGNFDLYIKGEGYLQQKHSDISIIEGTPYMDIGSVNAGDINGDNAVNFADFGLLAGSFNKTSTDDDFVPEADFNCDGIVNFADFGLLAGNFNQTGDEP